VPSPSPHRARPELLAAATGREKTGADHQRRVIGCFTGRRTDKDGAPACPAPEIPGEKVTHLDYAMAANADGSVDQGYTALTKTLREKLDPAGAVDGRHSLLPVAPPSSGHLLRGTETFQVQKYLAAGVCSTARYGGTGCLNTDWACHYVRGSTPAGRINIELPYPTRGFKNVTDGTDGLWGRAPSTTCPAGPGPTLCGDGAVGTDNLRHDLGTDGKESPAGTGRRLRLERGQGPVRAEAADLAVADAGGVGGGPGPESPSPSATSSGTPSPSPPSSSGRGTTAAWNSATEYTGGSAVSHKGRTWKAKWWEKGEEPGITGAWGVWQDLGSC
jgi:GH18 family chitinase